MKRAAVAVIAIALAAAAISPAAGAQAPQPQTNLADIADEVMCTVCGVPLELATEAPQARAERDFIRRLINQGKSKDEVKDALVAEYGENVLAVPGTEGFDLAAWLVPIGAFLAAVVAIALALRRWRRNRDSSPPEPPSEPDRASSDRLDADLSRYEL
ncbi:MAG: cytochrome c-type biogenesis protein CcmH [bacterium]